MLESYKCPNCGASLSIYPAFNRATCDYCNVNFRYVDERAEEKGSCAATPNPASVSFLREETEGFVEHNLFAPQKPIRDSYWESGNDYSFEIETYKGTRRYGDGCLEVCLISFLSTVSGMAHLLKKNYFVQVNGGSFSEINGRELAKARKRAFTRDMKRELERFEKECLDSKRKYDLQSSVAASYGFTLNETVGHQEFRPFNAFTVPHSFTKSTFSLAVTPQYFENYFPTIAAIYNRVKSYREIGLIVGKLIEEAMKYGKGANVIWPIDESKTKSSIKIGNINVWYQSDLGMSNAPDYDTALAIRLAVLGSFIQETSEQAGAYTWDLGQTNTGSLCLRSVIRRIDHYKNW